MAMVKGSKLPFVLFIGTVVFANWLVNYYGVVSIGFGLMAPAGVFAAGLGFTLRDWLQRKGGSPQVLLAIACGAGISAAISPQLALASATAFLVSETADWAVYTPIKNKLLAIVLSNTVGAVVDSIIFLSIAFHNLDFLKGQVIGKLYMTVPFVILLGYTQTKLALATHDTTTVR